MFSGIVEGTGTIISLTPQAGGLQLVIDIGVFSKGIKPGQSVAVDGVCLTVAQIKQSKCSFNVITETLSKTILGQLQVGAKVNIERSLKAGSRIDGHFVQGHVHGVGKVTERRATGTEFKLWITPAPELMRYIAPLGAIAVNGVSLTVAELKKDSFAVALIPTTLELTNLGELEVGRAANIETDSIARQVVHWLEVQRAQS